MKPTLFLCVILISVLSINGFLHSKKKGSGNTTDFRSSTVAKIYSNLAEIIQPLGLLPLEFSAEDWNDIRSDSITLLGSNVNVTQQTITEKKKPLKNAYVFVRSPSSSSTETKFIKGTLIDDKYNVVKLLDKDISKDPIYFTAQSKDLIYEEEPPQSKFYVNFTYDTADAVYLSYLRSNLNWKTRYQLYLIEESKPAVLIAMADIRNDGQSKVDLESAELLGGDINLEMHQAHKYQYISMALPSHMAMADTPGSSSNAKGPTITKGEEVSGLYVFAINEPFSIDAKTNFILPMFRPKVTVDRFSSISKYFYAAGSSTGKARRSYRLSPDRFLSQGDCVVREFDRLVGETSLPNLAAKNKHEFSIGEDADIVYKENTTLISSNTSNGTRLSYGISQTRTQSLYDISLTLKNYKKRPAKVEYEEQFSGSSVKLIKPNTVFTQDGSAIKAQFTLASDEEKSVSFKVEIIN